MTLQRVDRVELQDWRNWQGPLVLDELPSGLVVLAGANAIGKTGVWEAIVAVLLDRHWGTHTDRLRPSGTKGVLPRVRVDFRADGRQLRVEKHFGGTRDRAEFHELVNGQWVLRDKGEEAYLLCRRAVLGGDESAPNRGGPDKALGDTLMEVLLAGQGNLAAEAPAPGAVSIAVTDREAADTATHIDRLLAAVKRQCDEIWVGKRDRPKKGTALANGQDRRAEIEAELPALQERAGEIDGLVSRLSELLSAETDREAAGARNEEAIALRAQVKAHREDREAARQAEREARAEKEAATRLGSERDALRKKREEAVRLAAEARRHEKTTAEDLRRRETEQKRVSDRRDRLAKEVAQLTEWITHEERGGRLEHLTEQLAGVRARLERVEKAETVIADLEAELESLLLPTAEEWAEWDELQARWSRAEGARKAGAWKVSGRVPEGLTLAIDGEDVPDATVDAEATRDVLVSDGPGAALRLEAPRDLAEKLRAVTEEVRNFLGRFGVADITELRKRNEYVQADLERRLALARQKRADALDDATRNELLRDQVEIGTRIEREEAGTAPASERPDDHLDHWKVRLETRETDLADARGTVESGQEEVGSARTSAVDAERAAKEREEDREVAEAALAEHRTAYGSDDDVRSAQAQRTAEHEALHSEWRRREDARAMAETAKEERAERLSAGLGEILARDREVQRLEAEIDARRSEDPAAKLSALLAERAELESSVRAEKAKADALRLLERALGDEKQRVTHAIGQPVRDRVQRWVDYLLQDKSRVVVDESGRPVVVRTPAGQEVPLADQSYGTREQLSVLYRLAVADLVAGDSESGVCLMFDDPFGHTDKLRRDRMLEILSAEAGRRGHQILVFTCRPEDFQGVGHLRSLSESSTSSP